MNEYIGRLVLELPKLCGMEDSPITLQIEGDDINVTLGLATITASKMWNEGMLKDADSEFIDSCVDNAAKAMKAALGLAANQLKSGSLTQNEVRGDLL